ncbi:MAG TPA: TerC/Alx family metal homeostasis membrane protein [Candidatus Limnocylindria bacterium]|nr:TerC/Alx family metal homeostasis membrane protein [Candidatus Limnocylindria bacterium]
MITTLASTASSVHHYSVPWFMYATVLAVLAVYAIIEARHTRRDHVIGTKEATVWSLIYIGTALAFAVPVFVFIGTQAGSEYLAAWAIEKALSLDNLFVMGLIFTSFNVPPALERRMLNYGIAGAIIFRLIFIIAGFQLLKTFAWISIFFGLVLLRGAWKAFKEAHGNWGEEKIEITEQRLWKTITRYLPVHHAFDGHKLTTVVKGKRMLTLMAAIIILIELSDIVFAVDSVPAVLAVSPDRFIAYSSNVFAILGLRALFFVYQSISDRFWALEWGLAGILAWISFKMVVAPTEFIFGLPWIGLHIPVGISLGVLAILLFGSVFISLLWKQPIPAKPLHIED